MKKILFILVLLSVLGKAQSHRFIYEYKYRQDSLRRDSVTTDLMRLNITPDFSEFFSEKKAKADSIILNNLALKKDFDYEFSINVNSKEAYKNYKKRETNILCDIGIQQYYVKLSDNPNWKLLNESKKIGPYLCQKAITNFGGRTWTAWFTTELPFQEGPYIFKSLPGLIVELYDLKDDHHFQLLKNFNSSNVKSLNYSMKKIIDIDQNQYKTQWQKYKENPTPISQQMADEFILQNDSSDNEPQRREIDGLKKGIKKNTIRYFLTFINNF